MIVRKVALVIVPVLVLLGCSTDLPTNALDDPMDSVVAGESSAKASVSKDVVLDLWENEYGGELYYECLNDGQGETVDIFYSGSWVGTIIQTPSGNELLNTWVEEWDLRLVGQTTGDVWIGGGSGHVALHTLRNGNTVASESLKEVFTEEASGRKLKTLTRFWINTARGDADFSAELISCSFRGK